MTGYSTSKTTWRLPLIAVAIAWLAGAPARAGEPPILDPDAPAVVATANEIYVFARGADGALWHKWSASGRWSGWQSLGGALTSAPAAVMSGARLMVFARGTDGTLRHRWSEKGRWADWQSLGGSLSSAPAAVMSGARLVVFARGTDGTLQHCWSDGGSWSRWESLGGSLTSAPSAAMVGPRLTVFMRGTDGALHHRWYEGGWKPWAPVGPGRLASAPAAVMYRGRPFVFARGDDGKLYARWHDKSWTAWAAVGGETATAPAVAVFGDRLLVLAREADGTARNAWYDGAAWTAWVKLGRPPATAAPAPPQPPAPSPPTPPPAAASAIQVTLAAYGLNCGALLGNATPHLATSCSGKASCDYRVDYKTIGDPAPGCGKSYLAVWSCAGQLGFRALYLRGEAGLGKVARLGCDPAGARAALVSRGPSETDVAPAAEGMPGFFFSWPSVQKWLSSQGTPTPTPAPTPAPAPTVAATYKYSDLILNGRPVDTSAETDLSSTRRPIVFRNWTAKNIPAGSPGAIKPGVIAPWYWLGDKPSAKYLVEPPVADASIIVLHETAGLMNLNREDTVEGKVHFFVDWNGDIYQLADTNARFNHATNYDVNLRSIGIELANAPFDVDKDASGVQTCEIKDGKIVLDGKGGCKKLNLPSASGDPDRDQVQFHWRRQAPYAQSLVIPHERQLEALVWLVSKLLEKSSAAEGPTYRLKIERTWRNVWPHDTSISINGQFMVLHTGYKIGGPTPAGGAEREPVEKPGIVSHSIIGGGAKAHSDGALLAVYTWLRLSRGDDPTLSRERTKAIVGAEEDVSLDSRILNTPNVIKSASGIESAFSPVKVQNGDYDGVTIVRMPAPFFFVLPSF